MNLDEHSDHGPIQTLYPTHPTLLHHKRIAPDRRLTGQPGMACARASGANRCDRGLRKTGDLRCQERVSSMVGTMEVLKGAGQGSAVEH
jgi:hypothetical protein